MRKAIVNYDTATRPYHWVKQLPAAIKDLDAIPLLGNVSPFDFDAYAQSVAEAFRLQNVSFKAGIPEWVSKEQLQASTSGTSKLFCFGVSPLEGNAYLLVSEEEFTFFLSSILHTGNGALSPLEQPYEEVIKEFTVHEMIHLLSKGGFDTRLTPLLKETTQTAEEEYLLSIQIDVILDQKEFRPRLLLSPTFLAAWRARYPLSKETSTSIAKKTGQLAHLEIGKIILTKKEWSKVNSGDLLLFDMCSIDPKDEDKFRLMILVNGRPCFRARLKDHQLKILEFPLHYEVVTPMAKKPSDADEDFEDLELDEDELEDDDFEEDEDFDFDEDDEDFEDEEDDISEVEEEEEHTELAASEADEELEEDEESLTSHESSSEMTANEEAELPAKPTSRAKQLLKTDAPTHVAADTETDQPQAFDLLPLNISVEIGRLHLSTAQLSSLQPGNLLDLDIHPDDGVSLVFNDQVLAKGELLRIGETLGVRILEIGKN